MSAHDALGTIAAVLAAGIGCSLAADLLRVPPMVLLLLAGIALDD
jgi:Kef-type K+ transport system membrane component KefB